MAGVHLKFKIGDVAIIVQKSYEPPQLGGIVQIRRIGGALAKGRHMRVEGISIVCNDIFADDELEHYPLSRLEKIIYGVAL